MKRRNFVQSLLVVPAASVSAAEQTTPPSPPAAAAPPPPPAPPRVVQAVPKFPLTQPDTAAATVSGFFSQPQFAALTRLAALLAPPLKNNPGAIDAKAPEFLDFLIGRSSIQDKDLYRQGLDGLNGAAENQFHQTFAALDDKQADSIVRPLLVARAWDKSLPADPMRHFIAKAHDDLRTATMNSAEWSASASSRGRFNRGVHMYWKPIDPRVEG